MARFPSPKFSALGLHTQQPVVNNDYNQDVLPGFSLFSSSQNTQESPLTSIYSSAPASPLYQCTASSKRKTVVNGGLPLPGTKLKAYDKTIPDKLNSRFNDLYRLYKKPLADVILKKPKLDLSKLSKKRKRRNPNLNPGQLSMKCRYLGTSEATLKLYIVIQCEEAVSKRVHDFFNQRHVVEDLNGEFEVHIIEGGLVKFAAMEDIEVYGNTVNNTAYGSKVHLKMAYISRWATLGGVIQVKTVNNESVVFGLLAGHSVADLWDEFENGPYSSDDESERVSDSASDSDACQVEISSTAREDNIGDTEGGSEYRQYLGHITYTSFQGETEQNYDWALMEFDDGLPNSSAIKKDVEFAEHMNWYHIDLSNSENCRLRSKIDAFAITPHGIQKGSLVRDRSSILLLPGTELVETLRFTLDKNSDLCQ